MTRLLVCIRFVEEEEWVDEEDEEDVACAEQFTFALEWVDSVFSANVWDDGDAAEKEKEDEKEEEEVVAVSQ